MESDDRGDRAAAWRTTSGCQSCGIGFPAAALDLNPFRGSIAAAAIDETKANARAVRNFCVQASGLSALNSRLSYLDLKVETLYRRLDSNPQLPQGLTPNPRRREFTLEEAFTLRGAFKLPPRRVPANPVSWSRSAILRAAWRKPRRQPIWPNTWVMQGYRVLLGIWMPGPV